MSQIRLGLIGCGGMSQAHQARFHQLSERLTLAAAVDVVEERALAVKQVFPDAQTATDYRAILEQVDAVLIALPHHLHHPVALDCLAAGKHVLLEKPMALNERECLDLIAASRAADRVLMVAYCMRYHPLVARMKELLDERAYGEVFQVSIWTEQLTTAAPDHWSANAATLGGGQLFSHGCHYIDILLWYLGRPVQGSHLGTKSGTPWMDWEGTSNVTIEFEGGKLGYHFGTWGARGTRLGYAFHAHCSEGTLEADISHGKLIAHVGGKEQLLLEAAPGKHLENEMAHFLDCIATGRRPLTDAPGSLQGLRVIWRLYEAEQQHTVADLRGLGLDQIDLTPQTKRWTGVH
ncbi:MAG: Gfo/Idh/MocA family oxidoreductase [Chloroflexi bacterium]|jgi:predicted dehydrogenase|nr:Gfo/Idh/MocA family oxidoreductase [Chloroflexota bacterium]